MTKNSAEFNASEIAAKLKALDERVSRLEGNSVGVPVHSAEIIEPNEVTQDKSQPKNLEIHIGEYWFASVGILVLVLAFMFMLSLPWPGLHPVIPSLVGFMVCAAMVYSANRLRLSYKFICLQLWAAVYFLSYDSILRLFHFSELTLFTPGLLEYATLILLSTTWIYLAHQKRSAYLMGFSLTLLVVTALIIDLPLLTLGLNALTALLIVFTSRRLNSPALYGYGALMVYTVHLIWVLGNPIMTGGIQIYPNPFWYFFFILVYVSILSLHIMIPSEGKSTQQNVIMNALLNGMPAFLLFNVFYLLSGLANPLFSKLLFFIVFMGLALVFWKRLSINFSMVLFTLFAHGTISIGFMQSIAPPTLFVILIWQSLFVLANALWFRSQFIVISNFMLYILLFLAYSVSSGFAGIISVSFGFVALLSARLIRAFEEHFSKASDTLINLYLGIAFVSLPFALWKALPSEWVTFAWLGVTVLYYILGVLLSSRRYRWMGHWTLFASVIYVVLIATMGLAAIYRILTFFALGVVLLTVSTIYTRIRKRSNLQSETAVLQED
ncbi:MAG: hypothetical protein K9N35_12555 [Candidatus Marinimicrobia bacterium]|nr:hypothetical protein [Candidatus Neomarinimicrobiota bacterium]